jgi:hypothetical protein
MTFYRNHGTFYIKTKNLGTVPIFFNFVILYLFQHLFSIYCSSEVENYLNFTTFVVMLWSAVRRVTKYTPAGTG